MCQRGGGKCGYMHMTSIWIPLLLACSAARWPALGSTAAAARPNIVVIMADDLGCKDLHCYGNAQIDTPCLDRLAAEGMRFTDAYAAAPVCSPTRAAVFFHYPNYAFHKKNRLASAIRSGNHKLIKRYDDGSIELYNLKEDIGETHNLAARFPELAEQLDQTLEKWLRDVDARLPTRGKPGRKRN